MTGQRSNQLNYVPAVGKLAKLEIAEAVAWRG